MTNSTARALVYAVECIGNRNPDWDLDDYCKILEELAYEIQSASDEEKQDLIRAAAELNLPNWAHEVGIIPDDDIDD